MQQPRSLCILRLSAIGDVTHMIPVVRTLRAALPETELTWIIGKTEHGLVAGLPGVTFIPVDKAHTLRAMRALRGALKGRRFDVLLHMQVAFRASLLSTAVRAPVRIGFDRKRARDNQGLFVNRRIAARERQHVLDGFFGFLEALGIEERVLEWDLPIPPGARAFARARLPESGPVVVINPCSSARSRNWRNWRAERYAAVADHAVRAHGATIVLTGGPAEEERRTAAEVAAAMAHTAIDLVGATSLTQMLAVLDLADLVISPDTGPAHLATAAGTPVIGLYVTSNPDRTGPYLSRDLVVDRYPDAVRRFLGKSVDEVSWGKRVRDPEALDLITVADVTERIDFVLEAGLRPDL